MTDAPPLAVSPYEVIDGHSHVASTHFTPASFFAGVADNIAARLQAMGMPGSSGQILERLMAGYTDHLGDAQIAAMDQAGIQRSVLLLPDFTWALPDNPYTIAEMFEQHYAILQRHPGRFEVFAGVDPRWGRDGLDLFIRGVEEYGFAGLKLYPPCGYRADDPALTPFYEYCAAHRLPVLLHTGPTSPALSFSYAQPGFIDEPARRFGDIPFILAHGAVNEQAQCVQLCKYRPNVYLDLSGAQHSIDATGHAPELMPLLAAGINHKIIFGTDWPINNHAAINARLRTLITSNEALVPPRDARMILSGNIQRLLAQIKRPQRVAQPA